METFLNNAKNARTNYKKEKTYVKLLSHMSHAKCMGFFWGGSRIKKNTHTNLNKYQITPKTSNKQKYKKN